MLLQTRLLSTTSHFWLYWRLNERAYGTLLLVHEHGPRSFNFCCTRFCWNKIFRTRKATNKRFAILLQELAALLHFCINRFRSSDVLFQKTRIFRCAICCFINCAAFVCKWRYTLLALCSLHSFIAQWALKLCIEHNENETKNSFWDCSRRNTV